MRRRTFLAASAASAPFALLRTAWSRRGAAQVLVIGGGFGGAGCALALRRASPRTRVTLVDPEPHYVTCPMSNGAIVGLRTMASLTVSRDGLERAGVRCVRGRVTSVDARRQRVRLSDGAELSYDRLVMAPGIRFLWDRIEGLTPETSGAVPHAWQAGAQTEILAAQLTAMRPGGVFAISVPAGPMRCPPGPFERASLVAAYLKERNPRAKVLIFDANNRFPRQDAFEAEWRESYRGMIEWIPVVEGGAVLRVDTATKTLYGAGGAHAVDVASVIPPQAPAALAVTAGLASDHGWCPIAPRSFESTLAARIHVIGDACIADPMPKSASAGHAQAQHCALAIAALLEEREPPTGRLDSVCYSMLGGGRALSIHGHFEIHGGPIRPVDVQDTGSTAGAEQEARNAESWYEKIRVESFGSDGAAAARGPAGGPENQRVV